MDHPRLSPLRWSLVPLLGTACALDSGLKVNNNSPEATIVSHADGDEVREDAVVLLRGRGSDVDDSAASLEAAFSSSGRPLCDWAPLEADGSTTCEVLVPAASALDDERWSIELALRDDGGAEGFASVALVVTSTGAPTPTILSPADGAVAYADAPLSLLGHATDDLDEPDALIALWESSRDGALLEEAFDSNGESVAVVSLSPGRHDLYLTARDTADKAATTSISVVVHETNTAPSCTFTAPADGATGRPDLPTTVAVTVADAEEPATALAVTVSSDLDGTLIADHPAADGTLSAELTGLSIGTHTLTLRVDDTGGARCTASIETTIGTAPTIARTAPVDDSVENEGDSVRFAATITDGEDAPPDLAVAWSSDLDGTLSTAAPDAAGAVAFSLDTLSVGDHTITLSATDQDGQASTERFALRINGRPGAPTVSLSPDPARTDDALVAAVDVPSTDPEGDPVAYRYQWDVGGVVSTASTAATLPAAATAKGEQWTVTVTPTDGTGDGPPATAQLTIQNTPPVLASATLSPSAPTVDDTLQCTPGATTDADGDAPLTTTTSWTVDGVTVAATTATLDSAWFTRGQDVACTLTPTDGTDAGAPVAAAAVTIQNSAPALTAASIRPVSPTASDTLTCSWSGFSDADGDTDQSTVAWTVNGTAAGTATTLSGAFSSGDTVTCTVTPDDGTDTGSPVSDSVTVDNTAPSIASVAISPASPVASDTLSCSWSGFSDADGDADQSTVAWTVGGVAVGSTPTLSGLFARGDTVACTVTPDDGTDTGTPRSTAVTVANSAPVLAAVVLAPAAPTEGDTLACTPGAATDADGDPVSHSIAWAVNGSAAAATGTTLDDSHWAKGDTVTCTATPSDGTDTGTAVTSNTATVANAAPSIASVSITPAAPTVTDDLSCSYTGFSDPDGDTDQSTLAWTVNGTAAGTGASLSASAFTTGDAVVCTATPDDGTDTGSPRSASVSVGNTPPSIAAVAISPASAQAGDTLSCSHTGFVDADGDPDLSTTAWSVNGSAAGTGTTLTGGFVHGDTVTCTVTPYDGSSTGTPLDDALTVDNTAPTLAAATISPAHPATDDPLVCSASGFSDADGEGDQSTFAWTVNGSAAGTGTTLAAALTTAGDTVVCTATPFDGTDTGTPVSDTVTVDNTAPVLTSVSISPASPAAADTLSCSATATDADGDSVSIGYRWSISGTTVGTGATLAAAFSRGDTVVCTATPDDGTDTGATDTASVTVQNTAPVVAGATLSPTDATEGDTLVCTPGAATDADGDTVTTTTAWTVDGVAVSATTPTLADTFWAKGDAVVCTVTPDDGTDTGSAASSNTVTIANAAPALSAATISPASPTATSTIQCTASGFSDADGDADQSTTAWTVNGSAAGTGTTLATAVSGGDTVVCTVTPFDGTDTGTPVSDTVTVDNTAPVLTSVSISPASPAATDTLSCSATATDADGDSVSIGYRWSISGTTVGTGATLAAAFSRGDTVVCTATPDDGTDTGATDTASVTVQNTAPVVASVALSPTDATEGDTLVCSPATATDADGDAVTTTLAWFVDGVQVAPTTTTLGDTFWARGDAVVCTVTPDDGTDTGATASSNTVTIANAVPTLAAATISPGTPASGDSLSCTASGFSDADGDADQSTFAWTVNGSAAGSAATLAAAATSPGDTVVCTVTPFDGTDTGTPVSDTVTVQNTAPVLTSVSISPASPAATDTLSCSATATDADGDSVSIGYRWSISGTTVGTGATLAAAFSRGDTVVCTATPDDGTDTGATDTASVTVQNTAPTLASVALSPTTAAEGDTLVCTPGATSDADGDAVTTTIAWTVDGVLVAPTTTTLGDTFWDKGEAVVCTATPDDGTDTGSAVSSNTVTIANTAPALVAATISPSSPRASDTLSCAGSGFSDADGDADQSTIAWSIAGTPVGTGATLAAAATSPGDTVVCTITPDDGSDTGTPVSDTVTIQNTAPVISSVSVTPNTPTVSDTLSCAAAATDADGDTVSLAYAWSISGAPVGTGATLAAAFSRGDTVVCTATATDGRGGSDTDTDSEIIENSVPVVSSVSISPSAPVHASTLSAGSSTSDADGDAVSLVHQWTVNGVATASSSTLAVAAVAVKGDTIGLTLTPTDGFDSGSAVAASAVTVGNTAPTAPVVDATDSPTVGVDDIVCAVTSAATDVDAADTVAYLISWEADGLVYPDDFGAATGPDTTTEPDDTVPAADTSLAADWTCFVVATDGTDDSAEVEDTATVVSASASLDASKAAITYGTTSNYVSNAANFAVAEPYTFASAATVTGFGYTWAFGYCTVCELGVYTVSGSAPGALLGEVVSSSCGTNAGGHNTVSGSGFSVPAGPVYLGWNFASCSYGSTHYLATDATGQTWYYGANTAGDGLPDPWVSGSSVSNGEETSIYPIGH